MIVRIQSNACVDRGFYAQETQGKSFDEARALLIGRYLEKELDSRLEEMLKRHLNRCTCCTQFLGDLETIEDFKARQDVIPYAICPSSEALDVYLFDRSRLASTESRKIEKHLQECPLCGEEMAWLKNLEDEKVIEFRPARRNWQVYASVAAAVFFLALSSVLWWQKAQEAPPEKQLQALAVMKEPDQINYENLEQTAITLWPDVHSTYEQGVSLFRAGKFEEAVPRFRKVLKAVPQHSASLYLLGYCYFKLDDPEKAFALCDRAESVHPHSYERCMTLVQLALKTGHFDRALKEISALYHDAPDHPEIRALYLQITSLTRGRSLKM